MGALTTDRKRGVDYFTLNHKFPSFYSPEPNPSVDTHIFKKPKIALSMHLTPDRPNSSESAASRLSQYPKVTQRFRRELHAPFRPLKFGFSSSSRPNTRSGSADAMGNVLVRKYEKAKAGAISSLRYLRKDNEVIDVEAETVKDDVSEDSSIEVVGGREQRSVDSEQRSRESNGILANYIELDEKVAERNNFQPSSSSVVSDLTNLNSKVSELRLPDLDSDSSSMPLHKRLHDSAERRNGKLSSLGFQIKLNEGLRAVLQLLRPKKKPEEDVVREPFVPLTKEEEAEITRAFSGSNRRKVWVNHENSNIEITGEKLQCLRPGAWLNDEVINLYLELLKEREKREPSKYLKCHFFNTFFYKKLFNGRSGYDFKSVRRWTSQRKLGYCLLECDKIFVPIHKEVHWCLAVINKKDEKFQYLDSLRGVDEQVLKVLARYFVDEVKDKSGQDIDVSSWEQEYVEDLPEQENGFDCGMFMIKYADFYSRNVGLCFKQEHMPYFRLRTAKEILRLKAE